ncbi:unnamed protein product [Orchesella dallaii]|uniref:Uncharacterized protein n=1 Tax=Orchesella dallaii TaxID=48710 RepID=A0ABP1R598_9HEXA
MAHHDTLPDESLFGTDSQQKEELEVMADSSKPTPIRGRRAARATARTPSRWPNKFQKEHPDPQFVRRQEEMERIRAAMADTEQEEHFVRRHGVRSRYPNFLPEDGPRVSSFEGILPLVGSMGKYQWTAIIAILLPLAFCHAFVVLDTEAQLITPDHWCAPPKGIQIENKTQWKIDNLPYSVDAATGKLHFSKCQIHLPDSVIPQPCRDGWEYNQSTYSRTLITANNWVCNKKMTVAKAYVMLAIGSFVGAFIFGFVADLIGRRMTCQILAGMNLFTQFVITMLYNEPGIILFALFLKAATFSNLVQLSSIWVMEIVSSKDRGRILGLMGISNILGVTIFSSLAHIIRDSQMIAVVGLAIGVVVNILCHSMMESPRLLFRFGELTGAAEILGDIADRNRMMGFGSVVTDSFLYNTVRQLRRSKTTIWVNCRLCIFELFWRRRSLKIALRLLFIWFSLGAVDKVMQYNIPEYDPNFFFDFFLIRLPQLPGILLGTSLPYLLGRRESHVIMQGIFALLLFATGFAQIFSTQAHRYFGIFLRMFLTASWLNSFVFTVELISTDLRSAFCGMCVAFYYFFPSSIPHMDFMVQSLYGTPYFICTLLCIISAIVALFLPETMDEPLPDYLDDIGSRSCKRFGTYYLDNWVPLPEANSQLELVSYNPSYKPGEKKDHDIEADPADDSFVEACLDLDYNERMI